MSDFKPNNFLYIFSDQHTRRATGCYGHNLVKTPNIDRLAEAGTLFENAYCNGPICVPARASLATGRYVHDIETWDNCTPYHGQFPSWGHRLMAQGRHAASIGKLHYRFHGEDNGFRQELLPMHIMEGVGMLFTICRDPMPVSKKFADLVENSGGGDSTYIQYDHDITTRAVQWLDEEAGKYSDRPWALFVSLVCPHPPWVAPEPYYSWYPHEDIELPVRYGLDERPQHPGLEDFRQFFGVRGEFDEATLRRVTAAYYGMISYLDANIGKLIDALERNGLMDNTRILYTTDHGESMGQKGMFSKCNMFEESTGVPMILAGADVPRGQRVAAPTQLLDVFPTILQGTGTEPTDEDRALPGTSLLEIANGARPRRVILAEQHSAGARSAVFMVRKDNLKYVNYREYPAQLYDLAKDPLELNDVAADPAYRDALDGCEQSLRALLDPDKVDAAAKASQAEKLEAGGGVDEVVSRGSPGYTPAPGEEPIYM